MLRVYERTSSQMVNFDKTTVSFSKGVRNNICQCMTEELRVARVDIHYRYLGLPTVVGDLKGDY